MLSSYGQHQAFRKGFLEKMAFLEGAKDWYGGLSQGARTALTGVGGAAALGIPTYLATDSAPAGLAAAGIGGVAGAAYGHQYKPSVLSQLRNSARQGGDTEIDAKTAPASASTPAFNRDAVASQWKKIQQESSMGMPNASLKQLEKATAGFKTRRLAIIKQILAAGKDPLRVLPWLSKEDVARYKKQLAQSSG